MGKSSNPRILSKLNLFKNFSIKSRLATVIGIMSVLMLVIGGMGLLGMSKANEGLRTVFEDRTIPLMDLGLIIDMANRVRTNAVVAANAPKAEVAVKASADTVALDGEIDKLWTKYIATTLTPEEKQLTDRFASQWKAYVESRNRTMKLAVEGDYPAARENAATDAGPKFTAARETLFKLIELQGRVAKSEFEEAQSRYDNTRNTVIGLIATGIALALWLGIALIRAITRPLDVAIGHFGQIAQGNYNNTIDIERHDEIGKVIESLKSMQIKLGFDVAESKRIADENLRIRIGLDNVSTGVMIADTDRNIIYVNKSVDDILGKAEEDIRKQLPNFSATNLVGTSIDGFHKNPAHQAQLLATFTTTYTASMDLGGRSMVGERQPGHQRSKATAWARWPNGRIAPPKWRWRKRWPPSWKARSWATSPDASRCRARKASSSSWAQA